MGPQLDVRSPGSFAETLRLDPEAWALRISARWRLGVEAIIATGRLLNEAKAALPHGGFRQVLQQLPFGERKAQMLMAIANHPLASNPQYIALLPPSWGAIYDCTRLPLPVFERAAAEGMIRPDMERADIGRLLPQPERIPEPAESGDPDQNAAGGPMERPSMAAGQSGEQDAGETTEAGASASSSPALLAPVDPAAVEGAEGDDPSHAPPATSSDAPAAHMAGRVHPAGDLDFSPTPPWATRALVERVLRHIEREKVCKYQTAWEPACGEGHMAEVLREYFRKVVATDIDPSRGYADHVGDFLDARNVLVPAADWIITNPPFGDNVLPFIKQALDLAGTGVAMFLQLRYLEGVERYEQLYRDNPPTTVAPFVERVPLLMGKYDPEASTTTAFMWLVWLKGAQPKAPFWIPHGCKAALTKPDDKARFTQSPVEKKAHAVTAAPEPVPSPTHGAAVDFPDLPEALRRAKA